MAPIQDRPRFPYYFIFVNNIVANQKELSHLAVESINGPSVGHCEEDLRVCQGIRRRS